jgi:hypothetical protein
MPVPAASVALVVGAKLRFVHSQPKPYTRDTTK